MTTYTDTWLPSPSSSTASHLPTPSPSSTPSKRASRSSRISNDTDHTAFTRTHSNSSTSETFSVGDVVIVGGDAKLKQRFLAPPPYQLAPKSKAKGKGKKAQVTADAYDGWKHQDGLDAGDKVAVITRLYEDVKGRKVALVRWFARPGAVWGPDGPEEEDEQVEPYELYYTSDSTHLHESRVMRARAASNRFTSSPSSSPSKRSPSSSRSTGMSAHLLSASAAFRTPQHSDPVPVASITSHARVSSSPVTAADPHQAQQEGDATKTRTPVFFVRRLYDVKPVPGASFWGELEWEEVRARGVEVYGEKMEAKEEGEARDGWDVEAVMEDEDQEEEVVVVKKGRGKGKKKEGTKEREVKLQKVVRMVLSDGEESTDDERDEEDTFDPRSHHSDASSDDGEGSDGEDTASSGSEDDEEASDSDDGFPRTPTKRGRAAAIRVRQLPTPSSSGGKKRGRPSASSKATTSTAGRAAKRRRSASNKSANSSASGGAHNPLPPLLSASHLSSLTPFERAKALLHVSATPESLPCREEQREEIRQFLGDAILGRTGGCLYVHGVPGTGKTATVHSVVRELQGDEDMDAFTFVEINGMKISEPMAAFSHLWSALSAAEPSASTSSSPSRKLSPRAALSALESHFSNPSPSRRTTVVLVDELDQMLTKRQDVLYNFFNWPHVPHSRLVVVAVANTMDLPERELSGKIRSRLGTNRIPFQPYTWTELKRILEARLSLVHDPSSSSPGSSGKSTPLFDDVALQKIAKSVAGISGDARKALDVARRTLDRVALRLAKEGKSVDAAGPGGKGVRCTIQDATQAYNDMTRQGPAVFVRRLGVMGKVLLLAVAQCVRRAGVQEVEVDTVLTWHLDFLRQTSLLPSSSALGPPTKDELLTLLAQLHALRLVATESQRLDVFQRVRAAVDDGDLFAALRECEVLKAHVPKVM
ncbi:hypothetical protein JCM6882_006648 [Rhodosporidiobolus microsporus]